MKDFEREVIDRLARIEEHVKADGRRLDEHTEQDRENFLAIRDDLDELRISQTELVIEKRVAEEAGGKAGKLSGKRAGQFWSAGITAAILAIAEAAKAWTR